jgi:hypothetical protein
VREAQERQLDGFGDEFAVGVAAKSRRFDLVAGPIQRTLLRLGNTDVRERITLPCF